MFLGGLLMKSNKFNAKKTLVGGIVFDSKKEGKYYSTLNLLRKARDSKDRVVDIELQKRYDIYINDKRICYYKLDFLVEYADGHIEYVDVKGLRKGAAYQIFRLKKKMVEAYYDIEITEV